MMCDECGIRPATIRLMSIVEGEKVSRNLCAHCLVDVKKTLPSLDLSGLDGLLASLLAATKKIGTSQHEDIAITCAHCGTTFSVFQKNGLLGCAECYEAFREPLQTLLKRVHGQTQHTGRIPGIRKEGFVQKVSVIGLKRKLKEAISQEEYEVAAKLRDQIRELSGAEEAARRGGVDEEAHAREGL